MPRCQCAKRFTTALPNQHTRNLNEVVRHGVSGEQVNMEGHGKRDERNLEQENEGENNEGFPGS